MSNVRVLPHHYSRLNASDLLASDKRQFIHPPPHPVRLPTSAEPSIPPTEADTTTAQQSIRKIASDSPSKTVFCRTEQTTPSLEKRVQTTVLTSDATSTEPSITASNSVTSATSVGLETPPGLSTTTKPLTSIPTTAILELVSGPSPATTVLSETESSSNSTVDGTAGGNQTAGGDEGQQVDEENAVDELGPGWHVAAHTLLVAVAICVTLLLSCCCSVLLVVSWRGQRKRIGRYRTSRRGKQGSMRLIKYVLVKENSWKTELGLPVIVFFVGRNKVILYYPQLVLGLLPHSKCKTVLRNYSFKTAATFPL